MATLPTFNLTQQPQATTARASLTQQLPFQQAAQPTQQPTQQAQAANPSRQKQAMSATAAAFFPIPETTYTKIVNLEFVDMADLKPSSWLLHSEEDEKAAFPFRKKKEPVTDILIWIQCYAAMATILAEHHPSKLPHLLAYQSTIVRCAQRYQGVSWVAYDIHYRRKAAMTKSLDWGIIDQSAYAEFFTGSSKPTTRCHTCLEEHPTQSCPLTANSLFYQLLDPQQLQTSQFASALPHLPPRAMYYQNTPARQAPSRRSTQEDPPICGLFNSVYGNRCTLRWCSFRHVCSLCGGNHNRATCGAKPPTQRLQQQHNPTDGPPAVKRFRGRGRGRP